MKEGKRNSDSLEIRGVYGPSAVSARVAQIWLERFKTGDFDIETSPRPGRSIARKVDEISKKVAQDRHITSRGIGTRTWKVDLTITV